jgi:SAM-dependent methyltransferase
MVREAAERLGMGSSFRFAALDAQAISFASDAFDAVIANHMLYHVPDLSRALSEIRRVLRRAGRLYAATNGRSHLTEIADLIEAFDPALLPIWAKDRRTFDLDDGAEHLARWFADIRLYPYEDSLLVDEAEPLAAYVFSMPLAATQRARRAAFVKFIDRRLAESGPLRITKDAGLFVAVRA